MFSLKDFIKNGLLDAVGTEPDHRIIEKATDWYDKKELTEDDLAEIKAAIDRKNINIGVAPFADLQAAKVMESKKMLAEWLESNPMEYADGKLYSVTEEKQSLLNNNLTSYERAQDAGITYPLKWNSTGAECTEWTYEALVELSLAIAGYVAPKVAMQQALEIAIKACTTVEELDAVVIEYD